MAEPFISEIRIFSFVFAPKGWALCNGQLLPINQNQALFSLLGTTYGGDGRINFGLPNLQGRVSIHFGNNHSLGERGGEQSHTLSTAELSAHTHTVQATAAPGTQNVPANNMMLAQRAAEIYQSPAALGALVSGTVTNLGGSQPHLNMQPFLTLNFCIALQGLFPSQT